MWCYTWMGQQNGWDIDALTWSMDDTTSPHVFEEAVSETMGKRFSNVSYCHIWIKPWSQYPLCYKCNIGYWYCMWYGTMTSLTRTVENGRQLAWAAPACITFLILLISLASLCIGKLLAGQVAWPTMPRWDEGHGPIHLHMWGGGMYSSISKHGELQEEPPRGPTVFHVGTIMKVMQKSVLQMMGNNMEWVSVCLCKALILQALYPGP